MCGIGGILRVWPAGAEVPPPEVSIPEGWLDVLDESIKHRGPDGAGRFRDRAVRGDGSVVDVAMVHRRLSIIDHAGGGQPMVVGEGRDRLAVAFNGCIYNHRELRRALAAAGRVFRSDHSDTEVIPHGWRVWGFDVLNRLEGMYGAAVWDASIGDVVLLRDRFGEKPLYRLGGERGAEDLVAWSSSFAGLLRLDELVKTGGGESITEWLQGWIQFGWNQYMPHPRVREVLSGWAESLTGEATRLAGPNVCTCCELHPALVDPPPRPLSAEEVDGLLRSAVQARLEADVPLGVFLSGGIDSALIARYASEARRDIEAFTVRMPSAAYDESGAAAETARVLGVRHEVLECSPRPAEDLVTLIEQLGLPFGDSSLLPAAWVSRSARERVKVALGGEGGDELFLGYERHAAARWLERAARLPREMLEQLAELSESGASPKSRLSKSARFFRAAAGNGYKDLLAIFPPHLARQLWPSARVLDTTMTHYHAGLVQPHRELYRRFDRAFYLPCDLLRKSDTASMSVGLEVRSPMLDSAVAARVIHAPWGSLMPRGQRKGLLKQVARKYLPAEIVDRPKMGFAIPISEWFRSDYGGMRTLLMDRLRSVEPFGSPSLGIELDMTFVEQMIDEHMSGRRDHGQRLYMLLVLSIWADWVGRVSRAGGL